MIIPQEYLHSTNLISQGRHKLADDGSNPMVSVQKFADDKALMQTGLWECTPGSWHITRTTSESLLVLKGKATLYEADGSTVRVVLTPGVWHNTPAGWKGQWIVEETIRKLFIVTPP